MIEKGLIVNHPFDRLALTMWGRAVPHRVIAMSLVAKRTQDGSE
jgi:hypothetical protein